MRDAIPRNEAERLRALRALGMLDDPASEPALERIARLAALACDAPIAAVTLVDDRRVVFKASVGVDMTELPREAAFCRQTIMSYALLVVPDATKDSRFAESPLVAGPGGLRAYVGAPLITSGGLALGTLCVLDRRPRKFTDNQCQQLRLLAEDAVEILNERLAATRRERVAERENALLDLSEQAGGIGHWRVDLPEMTVTWSPEVCRMHGVSETASKPALETALAYIHPDDRERVRLNVEEAILHARSFEHEFRIIRPDGEVRLLDARGMSQCDAVGRVVAVFGVCKDITDTRNATLALKESEERFDLAVQAAAVGIMDVRLGANAAYWSDQLYHMLGYEPGDIAPTKENFDALKHPEDIRRAQAQTEAHLQIRSPLHVECRMRHKTAGYRWFLITGQAVWDERGAPLRLTSSVLDIHDLRLAQAQAEEANIAKSLFLSAMSHEIRTPLNGVIGLTSALKMTPLDDHQSRLIDVIDESGTALLDVINKILELSNLEAGRLCLEVEAFDIASFMTMVSAPHAAAAEAKGLAFQCSVAPEAEGRLVGDHARLRQIIDHLVDNAVKFTERGEIALTLERGATRDDGLTEFIFEVRDTGVGISREARERLFAPFMQVDASASRRHGGTGLGLAICRKLCEAMGGAIEVESAPNQGSVFRFSVAMEEGEATEPAEPAQPQQVEAMLEPALSEHPIRVLAADDHPNNRVVLKAMFLPFGADVTFVENGREAVAAWAANDFDLILMDVRMPVMDGVGATREIRRAEQETGRPRTPIIALTAHAMKQQVAEYLAAGMDAHIAKPIRSAQLFEAICAALTSKQAMSARSETRAGLSDAHVQADAEV